METFPTAYCIVQDWLRYSCISYTGSWATTTRPTHSNRSWLTRTNGEWGMVTCMAPHRWHEWQAAPHAAAAAPLVGVASAQQMCYRVFKLAGDWVDHKVSTMCGKRCVHVWWCVHVKCCCIGCSIFFHSMSHKSCHTSSVCTGACKSNYQPYICMIVNDRGSLTPRPLSTIQRCVYAALFT